MQISIIIPTYNRENLIKYTLDSLSPLLQPTIELEIIVIDDGSTDNTIDLIAKNYPNVILMKNTGKGAACARNYGLKSAKGKYILYLDSDDLLGANYLKNKIELLEQNPGIDACYGEYDFFESNTNFTPEKIIFKHKYPVINNLESAEKHLLNNLEGNFLPPNTLIWRRDFLIKIGGHDENLSINQDVELLIRAIFNSLKIIGIKDDTKAYIRNHNLDLRVGNAAYMDKKLYQILELRKTIYENLEKFGYSDPIYKKAISNYLFDQWRNLRIGLPVIANDFLTFAKQVYWPLELKGGLFIRTLSTFFGAENAIKIKYFLLKRN